MLTHWRLKKNHLNWCKISFCKIQHSFMIKSSPESECRGNMLTINCSVVPDSVHPMDRSLPGFVFHGIFQTRILEWVSISYSKGFSWCSDCLLHFLHWQVYPLPLHNLSSTEGTYFNIIKWAQSSQVVLAGKNLPASAGDIGGVGSIPGPGRSPERSHGN